MSEPVLKYGLQWDLPDYEDPLQIELQMIRSGGYVTHGDQKFGKGLFHHYREAQSIAWPDDDHHRWSDLLLATIVAERICVAMGPRDCGKTHGNSKYALIDYWAFPQTTLTLMSSTGLRELELRVWGDVKDLFQRAKKAHPWLAGNINQANHGIFTDNLDERGDVRDMRKGIICVPCIGGEGEWIGMDRFVGIKQLRRRLMGDEMQFMHVVYVNVIDAMDKGDFKGVFSGNPIGGNGKALDKVAEPIAGWNSLGEVKKTRTWRNRYSGVTINFVGPDSPNFDKDRPKHYPYLIDQGDIDRVVARNGKDSAQYWTLIMGVRKVGLDMYRVLTTEMCKQHGAYNSAVWAGGARTKVYAIDAGFGGDPCEVQYIEFGEDVNGNYVIEFSETQQVPIEVSKELTPEDQIALYVKADCDRLSIPYENVFFDAGMRATLAISMARIISPAVNAVNFQGPATDRPVSEDTFVIDPKTKQKRLMKCAEQYSKFVTELWFSVREVVEAGQARSLPESAAEQFGQREWHWVPGPLGQRYEMETKPEYKTRMGGESPNKADVTSIGVEGCRRRGFQIRNPKVHRTGEEADQAFLERELQKHRKTVTKRELQYQ